MTLSVQEDVLQLEVPVDDVVPVQEVDGEIQLRRIKPRKCRNVLDSKFGIRN